jgi:hypothetical protein
MFDSLVPRISRLASKTRSSSTRLPGRGAGTRSDTHEEGQKFEWEYGEWDEWGGLAGYGIFVEELEG